MGHVQVPVLLQTPRAKHSLAGDGPSWGVELPPYFPRLWDLQELQLLTSSDKESRQKELPGAHTKPSPPREEPAGGLPQGVGAQQGCSGCRGGRARPYRVDRDVPDTSIHPKTFSSPSAYPKRTAASSPVSPQPLLFKHRLILGFALSKKHKEGHKNTLKGAVGVACRQGQAERRLPAGLQPLHSRFSPGTWGPPGIAGRRTVCSGAREKRDASGMLQTTSPRIGRHPTGDGISHPRQWARAAFRARRGMGGDTWGA